MLAIHGVDEDGPRDGVLGGIGHGLLRADGQTRDRAHHDERRIHDAQGAHHLADEVEVAGNIDEIDLGILPFDRGDGGADGELALDFLGVVIRNGAAILNAAHAVNRTRGPQQRFGQRGLALAAVADNRNIANILGLIIFHTG